MAQFNIQMNKILKDSKKDSSKEETFQVLMVGGRRGEIRLLTCMDQGCSPRLAGIEQLSIKRYELMEYFAAQHKHMENLLIDDAHSSPKHISYSFDIDINDKDLGNLKFTDIPDEWLDNPAYAAKMQDAMNRSQIIIIAVDTPHLAEEADPALGYGKYHTKFNRVPEITAFLKNAFKNSKEHRLVIFVPLKCEKYYYQNATNPDKPGMPMVNEMVKKGYRELIDFLTGSDIRERCTCAIMPVLTQGVGEFFEFEKDSAGHYSYVPSPVLHKFGPQYCEQPLLLTLQYVIAMTKIRNSKHKITAWFSQTFGKQAKLALLTGCERTVKSRILTDAKLG